MLLFQVVWGGDLMFQGQLGVAGLQGQGAILSIIVLLVLLIPMVYYVISTNRSAQEAT